jgi:hypothetical protein
MPTGSRSLVGLVLFLTDRPVFSLLDNLDERWLGLVCGVSVEMVWGHKRVYGNG